MAPGRAGPGRASPLCRGTSDFDLAEAVRPVAPPHASLDDHASMDTAKAARRAVAWDEKGHAGEFRPVVLLEPTKADRHDQSVVDRLVGSELGEAPEADLTATARDLRPAEHRERSFSDGVVLREQLAAGRPANEEVATAQLAMRITQGIAMRGERPVQCRHARDAEDRPASFGQKLGGDLHERLAVGQLDDSVGRAEGRSRRAPWSAGRADRADRACRASRAGQTCRACRTLRTSSAGGALRPLCPLWTYIIPIDLRPIGVWTIGVRRHDYNAA